MMKMVVAPMAIPMAAPLKEVLVIGYGAVGAVCESFLSFWSVALK